MAQAEADKYSQPSPNVLDHVSAVGLCVQENLDLDESRKDNQEGLDVSGSEGFAGRLLDDQTYTSKSVPCFILLFILHTLHTH